MADKGGPGDEIADLLASFRQVAESGQAGLEAARDATKAMRTLVAADVSLARSALGRSLACTAIAIVLGVVSGLMLVSALVYGTSRWLDMPLWASFLMLGVLCALGTAFAGWRAMRYFDHTRMKATRRQLARLGIGELSGHTPRPGSPQSAREATETMPTTTPDGGPIKDPQGIDITPP